MGAAPRAAGAAAPRRGRPEDRHSTLQALEAAFGARGLSAAWARFRRFCAPQPNGCIDWIGARNTNGYGVFWLKGKLVLAHRLALTVVAGRSRRKPLALHACDRPCCVAAPEHLSWGTQSLNTQHQYQRNRRHPSQVLLDLIPGGDHATS